MGFMQTGKALDIVSTGTTVTFTTAMDSADYNVIGRAYITDEEGSEMEIPCSIDTTSFTVNGFLVTPTEDCHFDYIALIHGAYTV